MHIRSRLLAVLLAFITVVTACAAPAAPLTPVPPPTAAPTTPPPTATATQSGPGNLNVYAAASLTAAFGDIGKSFEAANPGTRVTFNFAGSSDLAAQIGKGAPADVFASANEAQMAVVVKSGQIAADAPRPFARNRLVVIYPTSNPAKLAKLQDLANPGVKVVLAAKAVPVGQYALDFLAKANKDPSFGATYQADVVKNVVSYEQDVKAVLTKVTLGEADVGIVYTTDVTPDAASKVGRFVIPDALNTIAVYPIAAVKTSPQGDLAKKFVDYVLGTAGQMVLVKYGFIPTNGSATGGAPPTGQLAVSGAVDKPGTLTTDALKQMPQSSIKATDKGDTSPQPYSGVLLTDFLKQVGASATATQVTFRMEVSASSFRLSHQRSGSRAW
ncbi:MAG TPA: molybdate ABC transporter substrate-binding protein [Chloroflexota bacterium]|nr:molybdate ABC transporter substrate-binding protein [Chloroflexota bacterium]